MVEGTKRDLIRKRLKEFYGNGFTEETTRDDPLDIDSFKFDFRLYMENSLNTKDLSDLVLEEKVISDQIRTLDSDMQTLVYENYSKFINATDTIKMVCNFLIIVLR